MNIKEKLAPRAAQSRQAFAHVTHVVETSALAMPRPLEKTSTDKLDSDLTKAITSLLIAIYKVKTNRHVNYGLQDRELNKLGRVSAVVAIVASSVFIPVAVHERWIRTRTTSDLSPLSTMMKELLAAAESAANQDMNFRRPDRKTGETTD